MATFTITTPTNISTLASKTGSDTYTINGGYLTVDQDTRYGTNQSVSAGIGNITLSATLGGTVEFNSTLVRIIPFNSGSGTVPAYDTLINQGSASGKLIGIYSALNVAPTAVASAMPVTGFIKIRQWNSVSYTVGALTNITASATDIDRAGWLEIVGVDALTCTVNRLNLFKVRGDYYDFLGVTTDGNRTTTYQIPSNGSIVYAPGVEVETSVGSGVYEFYPCAGSTPALAANIATDGVRGRWCWISTAGLLRFGSDGTNSTGGFIPQSGRKIRIPNIFFMCCTAAALTVNVLPNATLATRYKFSTTGGGVIDIDKCSMNWYPTFTQPYSVNLSNSYFLTQLSVSEISSPLTWDNVGVGQEASNTQFGLVMSLCFGGGIMNKCTWTRATLASTGNYVTSLTDLDGFVINYERNHTLGASRGNATVGVSVQTRVSNSTWNNMLIGGGRLSIVTNKFVSYNNSIYYDNPATTTTTTIPMYIYDLISSCSDIKVDGLSFGGLSMCQPYSGVLSIGSAGCANIKIRNIGTYLSPLDMGGSLQNNVAWTRATTVATVTKVSHGLKVGDILYTIISSDIASIVIGSKTVATVPTSDTFTFTCLNAGAASGTLTYYPTMASILLALGTGAAANNVFIQRCYTTHLRTNLYTSDNSSKNITFESVYGDFINAPAIPQLNGYIKGIASTIPLSAQTGCYGTHFQDYFIHGVVTNVSNVLWSRVTTVATVTSNSHNMRTGMLLNVIVSSDTGAILLGQKSITVLTSNTFTFACLNAGAASGTLSFTPYSGRVSVLMNEPSSNTASYYNVDSGVPVFTSAGGLYMPVINQQVTFTSPSYIIGHGLFPISQVIMGGGTITNYDILYSIDKNDGNGFGAFNNLNYTRLVGGGVISTTNVTMTSTIGVGVGDYVFGTNISPNAKVVSITNATTIVVDKTNIGTVSGTLVFNKLPSEIIDAQLGFRIKIRIKTIITNTTAITSLYLNTDSTDFTRAYQYPLDTFKLTISGLVITSDVVILQSNTSNVLYQIDQTTINSFIYTYETTQLVDICIYKSGYKPYFIRNYMLQSVDTNIPVSQISDLNYLS
jgi:hypothetical protein